jgi:hypothetical protein
MGCSDSQLIHTPRDQLFEGKPGHDNNPDEGKNQASGYKILEAIKPDIDDRARESKIYRITDSEQRQTNPVRMTGPIFSGPRLLTRNQRSITDKFGEKLLDEYYYSAGQKGHLEQKFWHHRCYVLLARPFCQQLTKDKELLDGRQIIPLRDCNCQFQNWLQCYRVLRSSSIFPKHGRRCRCAFAFG